jgi:hypothetical protein
MGAKLKSKTHLLNRFWYFEPFFARLASKILKSATRTQVNGFEISVKFDTLIEFMKKNVLLLSALFKSLNANAHEMAQKNWKPFL